MYETQLITLIVLHQFKRCLPDNPNNEPLAGGLMHGSKAQMKLAPLSSDCCSLPPSHTQDVYTFIFKARQSNFQRISL